MTQQQRNYIAFRHMYESVPKWEKERFIDRCADIVRSMYHLRQWGGHTYARSILYLLERHHNSTPWWDEVQLYAGTEFFTAFLRALYDRRCLHNTLRTPVLWCSACGM